MAKITTAERVSLEPSDNFVYQRSRLAYHYAAERVEGRVLEIGTGSGYGVDIIAPRVTEFITIDKFATQFDSLPDNVRVVQGVVPPLPLESESVDCVVSFQVIEHIKRDDKFIDEVYRVLKKGGLFILSTPNAPLSLTRNPWHVREYTAEQLRALMQSRFLAENIEARGVVGGERVMEYYEQNRRGVERITRFDILDLQHRLPAALLRIPYDILNRINRRRLLSDNRELTQGIEMEDYSVVDIDSAAQPFDLLFTARK